MKEEKKLNAEVETEEKVEKEAKKPEKEAEKPEKQEAENADKKSAKKMKMPSLKKSSDKKSAELAEKLESLEEELKEEKDGRLRLAAEYDNFRKRSRKEKDELYGRCVCDTVGEFLPLLDNLDRAIEAGKETKGAESMLEGIELVKKQALEIMASLGVEEIDAEGKSFDPELHEAAMHIEDESYDTNTVVEVFNKGYIRDGRVIRHSVVKVAN